MKPTSWIIIIGLALLLFWYLAYRVTGALKTVTDTASTVGTSLWDVFSTGEIPW